MKVHFEVTLPLKPRQPSLMAGRVYGAFGLEAEQGERTYVEPFALDVEPGQIVAFIGVSGTGKTKCLDQFAGQADAVAIGWVVPPPNHLVVEYLAEHCGSVEHAMEMAGRCGLAEAQLLLRYPNELSEGQRYRVSLAAGFGYTKVNALVADEFLATLDRTSAKAIAFNVRRLVTDADKMLAVATTHTDILDDLAPDHLVTFDGTKATVGTRPRPKGRRYLDVSPLREAPEPTGPGSRPGTTAATQSVSHGQFGSSLTTRSRSASASSAQRL